MTSEAGKISELTHFTIIVILMSCVYIGVTES
jgi:hypothetical protein